MSSFFMKVAIKFFSILPAIIIIYSARAENVKTYESLWDLVKSTPNHKISDGGNAIVVDVSNHNSIYYFSKPGTPVYPSGIKRTIIEDSEGVTLQTEGWSFGPESAQPAFQAWLAAFRKQASEIQMQMRNQGQ